VLRGLPSRSRGSELGQLEVGWILGVKQGLDRSKDYNAIRN